MRRSPILVLAVVLMLGISSCATLQEITPVACATADDVCRYAHEVCRVINDTSYTAAQVDSVQREFYGVQSRFYYETSKARKSK